MKISMLKTVMMAGLFGAVVVADEVKPDAAGWVTLFNGQDLSGWTNAEGGETSGVWREG